MYRFPVRSLEGSAVQIVYIHPTYTDYGVAFKVERQPEETFVSCNVVTGDIANKQQLRSMEDFSAPLDVNIWALNAMRIIQNNTVNTASIDIDNLFANHAGTVVYAEESAPATTEPQAETDTDATTEQDTDQPEETADNENSDQESTS